MTETERFMSLHCPDGIGLAPKRELAFNSDSD